MMIKITEQCSMGCHHCMNDAKPNGKHMSFDVFKDALSFAVNAGAHCIIITGGEPLENPSALNYIKYAMSRYPAIGCIVTTNGQKLPDIEKYVREMYEIYGSRLLWQVSYDPKYYPQPLDLKQSVFECESVGIIDKIEHISPQGRALDNALPYDSTYPKCTNVRIVTKQLRHHSNADVLFRMLIMHMENHMRFCTPHIGVDGSFKLGESDLCPVCSTIYSPLEEIVEKILTFKCNGCKILMTDNVKQILGEK